MSIRRPTRGGQFIANRQGIAKILVSKQFLEAKETEIAAGISARALAQAPVSRRYDHRKYRDSFRIFHKIRRDASGTRFVTVVANVAKHAYYVETGNVNVDAYAPLRRAAGASVVKERRPGKATPRRVYRRSKKASG